MLAIRQGPCAGPRGLPARDQPLQPDRLPAKRAQSWEVESIETMAQKIEALVPEA
jgi:hypothetical protein